MPFIDWHEDFSVGIASIDSEHQTMLALLNKLYDSVQLERATESISDVLDGLILYIVTHFLHEEQYMLAARYPDYEQHKTEHESLRHHLMRIQAEAENGPTVVVANELLAFLKSWVMGHILFSDKAFAPYVKARGLAG